MWQKWLKAKNIEWFPGLGRGVTRRNCARIQTGEREPALPGTWLGSAEWEPLQATGRELESREGM